MKYTDKHVSQWRVVLIPVGGYVRCIGDGEDVSAFQSSPDVQGSFASAHAWKKAASVFSGLLFNGLFTIVMLTFFFFVYGCVAI